MKPKLYLLLLASVLVLASCTKWVPENDNNRIVGNWRLVSVVRDGNYGSEPVNTGYENGTFNFSNNGNARFTDHIGQMNGSWRLVPRSGYYDGQGNGNNSLELRLYDHYNDDAIEWEFYAVDISSNRLVGYMNRYGYEYRYEFRRY
jgi:hypothetical protein